MRYLLNSQSDCYEDVKKSFDTKKEIPFKDVKTKVFAKEYITISK